MAIAQHSPVVYLMGVGGTGKTLLANTLEKVLDRVLAAPSFTRICYARAGFNSEADARKDFQTYAAFQHEMTEGFPVWANKYVREHAEDADAFIFQRSPLDYAAYTTTELGSEFASPHLVNTAALKALRRRKNTTLVHFPYPTPWAAAGVLNDGMRSEDVTRDMALEVELQSLMKFVRLGNASTVSVVNPVALIELHDFDLANRVNAVITGAGLTHLVKKKYRGKA